MKQWVLVSWLLLAAAPTSVTRLELDHQPFLDEFRAAEGRVRVVTVLSPT